MCVRKEALVALLAFGTSTLALQSFDFDEIIKSQNSKVKQKVLRHGEFMKTQSEREAATVRAAATATDALRSHAQNNPEKRQTSQYNGTCDDCDWFYERNNASAVCGLVGNDCFGECFNEEYHDYVKAACACDAADYIFHDEPKPGLFGLGLAASDLCDGNCTGAIMDWMDLAGDPEWDAQGFKEYLEWECGCESACILPVPPTSSSDDSTGDANSFFNLILEDKQFFCDSFMNFTACLFETCPESNLKDDWFPNNETLSGIEFYKGLVCECDPHDKLPWQYSYSFEFEYWDYFCDSASCADVWTENLESEIRKGDGSSYSYSYSEIKEIVASIVGCEFEPANLCECDDLDFFIRNYESLKARVARAH